MNPVDLNFASSPFRNNTPYYLAYGLGTVLLIAFTAYNSWAFFAYSESRAILESDHAAKKARLDQLYQDASRLGDLIKKEDIEAINSRATFTNSLLDRRRFSWTDLLNSLEEVQPYQVRLLSLLPRIQNKGILIDARIVEKDLQAYWNFQQNLQNHPKFRRVYPGGYLRNPDAGEYVSNLQFNYFPKEAPADVQGLPPEAFQIVQAPGVAGADASLDDPEATEDLPEELPEEPLPPSAQDTSRGKAARAVDGSSGEPGPAAKGMAGAAANPVQPVPLPPPQPLPPAPAPVRTVLPNPQPGSVPGSFTAGPAAGAAANPSLNPPGTTPVQRWPGRGSMPGSAGAAPPPAIKPAGVPTVPMVQPPAGSDASDDAEEPDDSGDDEGGE